jgi:hypothetical protein
MTSYPYNTLKEKSVRLGDWHSFWLPGYPKDGEYWGITKTERGGMPVNYNHKRTRGKYREGGPWLQMKQTYTSSSDTYNVCNGGGQLTYSGHMHCPDLWLSQLVNPSQQEIWDDTYAWGAMAYKRLRPDKPDFNQAMALLELKDVIPGLAKACANMANKVRLALARKGLKPRKLPPHRKLSDKKFLSVLGSDSKQTAEYYLAVQFGWLPLLSDILSFTKAYFDNEKRVLQILRDAGKPVRRSGTLHKGSGVTNTGSWTQSGNYANVHMSPGFVTGCYNYGDWPISEWKDDWDQTVWFSGQSRYYLPTWPDGSVNNTEVMRRASGLTWITPSNMYNLIPWSWAVDYFTGLGDFIEGTDPGIADTWIVDYAYIMSQRNYRSSLQCSVGLRTFGGSPIRAKASMMRSESYKTRVTASIFGFGLSQTDLNPKQISILGAIGISAL